MEDLNSFSQTVVGHFESHVKRDPGKIAIKSRDVSMSYQALDRAANQVAHSILPRLEHSDHIVAALFAPSLSLAIGLLATFKAGKTYLPLEPTLPEGYLKQIILKTGAKLVLTDEAHIDLAERLAVEGATVLAVDNLDADLPVVSPSLSILPESLAWILHTTGSTGEPKGVMHSHRNLIHADMRFSEAMDLSPSDRIMRPGSTMAFAGGLKSLIASLIHGCRYVFCTLDELSQPEEILLREEITIFHSKPSVLRHLLDTLSGKKAFPKLRAFCVAGDKLYKTDVERFRELFPSDCVILNHLALSEAGTVSQLIIDKKTALDAVVMSIGYPLQDTEILLLDEQHLPVKMGETGEIAIKSRYLTQGYWGNEELTKKAFLSGAPGCSERVYLTGDLGRFIEDSGGSGKAQLFHLGRKDYRVMIRGFQVDTRQVEDELKSLIEIKEAEVTALSDGATDPKLVAYIIPSEHGAVNASRLRREILKRLPEYMAPSAFVFLDAFPLTSDGKLDRSRLPRPDSSRPDLDTPFSPPGTPVEIELAAIWEKVLGVSSIGVNDNFFELGGHSLQAVQLAAKVEKLLGRRIPITSLFKAPTIESLARMLCDENWTAPWASLVPLQPQGSKPPFFFVHGWGGDVFVFLNIARSLGADQPVYGIQSEDGKHAKNGVRSIEELASHYVEEIRSFQAEGPYYLGGYSMGGWIAFEIARQLTEQGQKVQMLAFLDTLPSCRLPTLMHLRLVLPRLLGRVGFHARQFFRTNYTEQVEYIMGRWRALRNILWTRLWQPVYEPLNPQVSTKTIPTPAESFEKVDYRALCKRYRPGKYRGSIDLFKTEETNPAWPKSLNKLVMGGVKIHRFPGEHHSMMLEPENLPEVAEVFGNALEAAQGNDLNMN